MKSNRNRLKKGLAAAAGTAAAALLVFLAVRIVAVEKSINELLPQLFYLQDSMSVLQSDLGTMEANIETALEEESSLIEEYSIRAKNCDFEKGTYDVEITILPKEYTESTQVTVYFGTKGCTLELSGISFKGNATLSMANTYDGNVTVLFTNGEKRSTEVLNSYKGFQTTLTEALAASLTDISAVFKNGEWVVGGTVAYDLDGKNSIEFTSFRLTAEVGNETVYDYDLIRESGGALFDDAVDTEQTIAAEDADSGDTGADGSLDEETGSAETDIPVSDEIGADDMPEDADANAEGGEPEETDISEDDLLDIGTDDDADPFIASEDTPESEDADEDTGISDTPENVSDFDESDETAAADEETISATSGSLPIEFSYVAAESDAVKIYLTVVTTEGITIRLTLYDGALSGSGDTRVEAMESYVPALDYYDKNRVQYEIN